MNSSLIGVYTLDHLSSDQANESVGVGGMTNHSMAGTLRLFKQIKKSNNFSGGNNVQFQGFHLKDTESAAFNGDDLKTGSKELNSFDRPEKPQNTEIIVYSNVEEANLNHFGVNYIHDRDTILLLSIPDYQTPQDFLLFMEGIHRKNLLHVRLLFEQDYTQPENNGKSRSSRFMMLFKFTSCLAAESFFSDFNGKLFTSFENDICHLVWIDRIIFIGRPEDFTRTMSSSKKDNLQFLFPSQSSASSSPTPSLKSIQAQMQGFNVDEVEVNLPTPSIQTTTESTHTAPKDFKQTSLSDHLSKNEWIEMPSCPVCLDRLDSSVTGLFTSLCNHTFHCSCIIKWDDTTCPVCRFHSFGASMDLQAQTERDRNQSERVDQSQNSSSTVCTVCSISENLWICLICAHVGCGRYQSGHAQTHYKESGHIYSLELSTQRVWDYNGDGYVHRIIQNTDGKLVHLPPPNTNSTPIRNQSSQIRQAGLDVKSPNPLYTPTDVTVAHKLESVNQEYQELISSTLLAQKSYHQAQLETLELKSIDRFVHLEGIISVLTEENGMLKAECSRLTRALENSSRVCEKTQAKYEKSAKKMEEFHAKLEEEKVVSNQLLLNYQGLQKKFDDQEHHSKNLEGQVVELKEQIRDLMFFLETRDNPNSEIAGASVVGVSSPTPSTPANKKGKKKR